MSQYTPMPWRYQEQSDAYTHIVRTGENRFLCQLAQDTSGEAEANARLIAAAPDLLAACNAQEEAEDFNANLCPNCKDGEARDAPELCEYCFSYYDKARCLRRAAIAKAARRS